MIAGKLAGQLGFPEDARLAVVHVDDIGMCHAANRGAFEALAAGPASCGSLMVPCPWFAEAAEQARAHPELDLGVHLTLNSEWTGYRWGPVSGAGAVPSLVEGDGCFRRTAADALQQGRPEEVELELRAQIERALAAGIDVTHFDVHMGTALLPPFTEVYAGLIREYRVAAFIVDLPPEAVSAELAPLLDPVRGVFEELAQDGFPVFGGFDLDLAFEPGEGLAHNRSRLDRIAPGVPYYLICHPAVLDDELGGLQPAAFGECRDFERRFYGGEEGRAEIAAREIQTIGMRPLRELIRSR